MNHHSSDKKTLSNLLICVTGSVATIKLSTLVSELIFHFNIKVVYTKSSTHFFDLNDQVFNKNNIELFSDEDEYKLWHKISDPVLHIELSRWADMILIAPLSASTLGKISNGICDNLLTLVLRSCPLSKKIVVCPAMNTIMYEHPITQEQLAKLIKWNYSVLYPIEKSLACGTIGIGAMENVSEIKEFLLKYKN